MKQSLSLLVALGLGVLITYAIAGPRHAEEWGVVVADGESGARVHGLFESKRECLKARAVLVEKYAAAAGTLGRVEKTTRTVTIKDVTDGYDELMTFSCLPFNDIRGLSFQTYPSRDNKE